MGWYDEGEDWGWFRALVRESSLDKIAATSSVQNNTDVSQNTGDWLQPDSPRTDIEPPKHPRHTKFEQHDDGQDSEDAIQYEPFRYSPIRVAFEALVSNKITLAEYGAQVQFRCGYEEIPVVVEWVVPDEQLQRASQVLLGHNFPHLNNGARSWFGYWDTGSLRHDLDGQAWMRVHLLPLSLVGVTLEETVEVCSTFVPKLRILTQLLPRYMLSLIRHLKKLPIGDGGRIRVERDLLTFIGYHILRGPAADPQESEESLQKRLPEGVQFMRTWDWGKIEQDDLATAESLVLDCRQVSTLTDVAEEDVVEEDVVEEEDDSSWLTLVPTLEPTLE